MPSLMDGINGGSMAFGGGMGGGGGGSIGGRVSSGITIFTKLY